MLFRQAVKFVQRQVEVTSRINNTEDSSHASEHTCPHQSGPASHALVHNYLRSDKLSMRDIVGMSVDFLLAGIDTSAYTSCFLLYHLTTNPNVQDKLHDKVQ